MFSATHRRFSVLFSNGHHCLLRLDRPCCWLCLPSVFFRFAQVTLREVMGDGPPRAFRDLEPSERERLYWDMKAQTTARRGVELQRQRAPPVRFGPPRAQAEQPRRGRRARVLSSDQRREHLAQSQSQMDTGAGQVRSPHPGSHITGSFTGTRTDSSVQSPTVFSAVPA